MDGSNRGGQPWFEGGDNRICLKMRRLCLQSLT